MPSCSWSRRTRTRSWLPKSPRFNARSGSSKSINPVQKTASACADGTRMTVEKPDPCSCDSTEDASRSCEPAASARERMHKALPGDRTDAVRDQAICTQIERIAAEERARGGDFEEVDGESDEWNGRLPWIADEGQGIRLRRPTRPLACGGRHPRDRAIRVDDRDTRPTLHPAKIIFKARQARGARVGRAEVVVRHKSASNSSSTRFSTASRVPPCGRAALRIACSPRGSARPPSEIAMGYPRSRREWSTATDRKAAPFPLAEVRALFSRPRSAQIRCSLLSHLPHGDGSIRWRCLAAQ